MRLILALPASVLIAWAMPMQSARAESLEGVWSGSGYAAPNSGQREKVSCRIEYRRQGSSVFGLVATCASSSAKIIQTGQLTMVNPRRYVGSVYNAEYNLSGRVRVLLSGSRQTVTFSSDRGSGQVTLSKR